MKRAAHIVSIAVCALALSSSGCLSVSTMHTATPVPKNEIEMSGRTGYVGLSGSAPAFPLTVGFPGGGAQQRLINLPTLEAQIRYGLSDRMDAAMRFFPIGLGLGVNYAPVLNSDVTVSFNPTVSATGFGDFGIGNGALNILVDAVKSEDWGLTVGAKQGYMFLRLQQTNYDFGFVGGMVMIDWQINETISLRPGLDALYFVPNNQTGTVVTQGMIGVNWKL